MSKVHDGWIPCTKYNKPPEGFGYDLSTSDEVDRHTLDIPWSDREVRGDYWRPAKCDGWILNDGTEPEGRVDVVLQGGNVIPAWDSEAWDSEAMDWGVFADGLSILWWRPAKAMVEEEQKPESARDGWIPCTKGNKPPEGFRFALKVRGLTYVDSEEIDPWADRVKRGDYWRPAADDGWQLNDGTKQTGQVEAVLRYGRVILDCDAVDLGWNVFDGTHSILWWRPAASAVFEEPETKENDTSEADDGWILCTAINEPPKGLRFDILNIKGRMFPHGDHSTSRDWRNRAAWGNYWRPAECDGWQLNDGTPVVVSGQVDVVLGSGSVLLNQECLETEWRPFHGESSALWWRPASKAVTAEKVTTEGKATNNQLLMMAEVFKSLSVRVLAEHVHESFGPADQPAEMQRILNLQRDIAQSLTEWDKLKGDTADKIFETAKVQYSDNSGEFAVNVDPVTGPWDLSFSDNGVWVRSWVFLVEPSFEDTDLG